MLRIKVPGAQAECARPVAGGFAETGGVRPADRGDGPVGPPLKKSRTDTRMDTFPELEVRTTGGNCDTRPLTLSSSHRSRSCKPSNGDANQRQACASHHYASGIWTSLQGRDQGSDLEARGAAREDRRCGGGLGCVDRDCCRASSRSFVMPANGRLESEVSAIWPSGKVEDFKLA